MLIHGFLAFAPQKENINLWCVFCFAKHTNVLSIFDHVLHLTTFLHHPDHLPPPPRPPSSTTPTTTLGALVRAPDFLTFESRQKKVERLTTDFSFFPCCNRQTFESKKSRWRPKILRKIGGHPVKCTKTCVYGVAVVFQHLCAMCSTSHTQAIPVGKNLPFKCTIKKWQLIPAISVCTPLVIAHSKGNKKKTKKLLATCFPIFLVPQLQCTGDLRSKRDQQITEYRCIHGQLFTYPPIHPPTW